MLRLLILLAFAGLIIEVNTSSAIDRATIALTIVAILAYLWTRVSVRQLTLLREPLTDHVSVGEQFTERLSMINGSFLPKPWLEVLDFSTLPGHLAGQVVRVQSKGTVKWESSSICRRRGEFELGPVRVRSGDPFGVFARTVIAPDTIRVLVWPVAVYLHGFNEPGAVFSGGPQRGWSPFTSPSVSGIREYVPGDPYNRIAWSATARSNQLMVKEFEQDPIADVWVVLDLQRDVQAGDTLAEGDHDLLTFSSTEEYGVAIAASICRTYIERGRTVGIIATSVHQLLMMPERGDVQLNRILNALAVVRADGVQSLAETLRANEGRFNRQSSIVVISSSLEDAWGSELARFAAQGIPTQVILLQPETFGADRYSLPFVGSLIGAGLPVATVANGDPVDGISNADTQSSWQYGSR